MSLFRKYLLVLSLSLAALSVFLPLRYQTEYPKTLGPTLDNDLRLKDREAMQENAAQLALLGDSILVQGIDPNALAAQTKIRTYSMGMPGSASAVWYLAIKNIIAPANPHPNYVVLLFRDTILTAPGYRVNGKYFTQVDELATKEDANLLQKAFIEQMSLPEQWLDRYFPVYGSRLRLRETIDYYLRYSLTSAVGCDPDCNAQANIAVFEDKNIDNTLLVEAIATAESYLYTPQQLNFEKQLPRSFLPDMVALAKENDIQLILVRTKHLQYPTAASEPLALRLYAQALQTYAAQNEIILLDFSHEDALTPEMFADSHHLNHSGMLTFTRLLADALQEVLPNP